MGMLTMQQSSDQSGGMGNMKKDLHYLAMVAAAHHDTVPEDVMQNGRHHDETNRAPHHPSTLSHGPVASANAGSNHRFVGGRVVDGTIASPSRKAIITFNGMNMEGIRRSSLLNSCVITTSERETNCPGTQAQFDRSHYEPTPIAADSDPSSALQETLSAEQQVQYKRDYQHRRQSELHRNFDPSSQEASKLLQQSDIQEKQMFLTFIYALYKHIDESSKESASARNVKDQVRQVVKECTRSCRLKIPGYSPLANIIKRKLATIEGIDVFWEMAEQSKNRFWSLKMRRGNGHDDVSKRRVVGI